MTEINVLLSEKSNIKPIVSVNKDSKRYIGYLEINAFLKFGNLVLGYYPKTCSVSLVEKLILTLLWVIHARKHNSAMQYQKLIECSYQF